MHTFHRLFVSLGTGLALLAGNLAAQDIAAAVAPPGVTVGPRLLIVQKTTNDFRWRALNAATTGWEPWVTTTLQGSSHYDGYDRVALAPWNDDGNARYNAFETVIKAGAIEVAETRWDFGRAQPILLQPNLVAPTTNVGTFFFAKDAVGRTSDKSFSAFGTSVRSNGNGGLVYAPRELLRGSPAFLRDMGTVGGATPEVFFSAYSTTLRDASFSNFDRTTAVMHQYPYGARTVSLYSMSNAVVPVNLDTRVDLGSPPGVMTQAPLLFIHDNVNPGPMNLFTVARDATGRRRLFERFSTGNQTQAASWSVWKDWGFPAGAPAAAADDFELGAALVWREPATQVFRVNMFGTRGGRLVERSWNGSSWNWGALLSLPAPGTRVTDGAVVTRGSALPRLSIFAVTPAGAPFELSFDWNQGRWNWQALN